MIIRERQRVRAALLQLGFGRTSGNKEYVNYELQQAQVVFRAQLWTDGCHRMSFGVRGHEWVRPAGFSTAEECYAAFRHCKKLAFTTLLDGALVPGSAEWYYDQTLKMDPIQILEVEQ